MYVLLIVAAALWGGSSGLLIPRIAYRLAVEPQAPWRSRCPGGHPITGPCGGWLGLARCATPDASKAAQASAVAAAGREPFYGPRTPVVAVSAAALCVVLAVATGPRPEAVVWLLAAPVAVLLAVVDHTVRRLPDVLTLPLAAGLAALLGVAVLLPGHAGSWPTALLGGVALSAVYFVLFFANPKGMGFGDVKLALALGVALGWYGWAAVAVGFLAGLVLGGGYGLSLIILRRIGRKGDIPLGPFMLGGTLLGLVLGAL